MILFSIPFRCRHYNYVGDSILGYKSHMGAGSITSNVKSDKTLVVVKDGDEKIETGLKKFGAMLGGFCGDCGYSVLNPGTVIGRHTNVYPLSSVRGVTRQTQFLRNRARLYRKKKHDILKLKIRTGRISYGRKY